MKLMEKILEEEIVKKFSYKDKKWTKKIDKDLLYTECKVHGKKVVTIIGVKANVHYKIVKRKIFKFIKKLGLYLNLRNSKRVGFQSIRFIAGAHGKIVNEE